MRSRARLVLGAALVAWIITALNAEAVPVLCKKKKGAIVVRDPTCREKETQLNLADFGALVDGSVTTAKLADEAVTGAKADESSFGKVPSAATADTADALTAPEGWHEVGAAGEPAFQNSWHNIAGMPPVPETVAFYKDHEGVVHLKGAALGGANVTVIFQLPAGYRPAPGKFLSLPTTCTACTRSDPQGGTVSTSTGQLAIFGSAIDPTIDGAVGIQDALTGSGAVFFDGIAFRAGS